MPFYISEYIGSGAKLDAFRPRGSAQMGWKAIDLRPDGGATLDGGGLNACLLWLPVHDPDVRLDRISDETKEALSVATKQRIRTKLSVDLQAATLEDAVLELMILPPANGWKPLRASRISGLLMVHLGPVAKALRVISGGASITEDWNCADSTNLTCDLTWTEYNGTALGIVGNRANISGGVGFNSARAEHDLSTDDHFAQFVIPTFTFVSSLISAEVVCRLDSGGVNTDQYLHIVQNSGGVMDHVLRKVVGGVDTDLDTDPTDWEANEVLRVEVDGSTIIGRRNGVIINGPITDTAIAGATRTRCGINAYSDAAGNVVEVDDFQAADLIAAGPNKIPFRSGSRPAPFAPGVGL